MNLMHLKKCIIGTAAVLGILTVGAAINQAYADEKQNNVILDNIFIGEVSVGGMNKEEADQAVTNYVNSLQDTVFTLKVNKKSISATASQLGVEWKNTGIVEEALTIGKSGSLITRYKDKKDLEHEPKTLDLSFQADTSAIKKYLKKKAKKINQKAKDSSLIRENGAFTITSGEPGISVNVSKSAKAIASYISNEWDTKESSIELAADIVQPRGTESELSKVKDVLGTFTTDYSASTAGRIVNVENGCSRINGTLLYPGDEFSVHDTVAPFDAEHGYELAGSFENGAVVDTYGGGICQVSTTLYNAVIRAELEVKERFPHSMIVTYVEPSMDAAIAGTYMDLKFINTTDAPVYIDGSASGGILTFTLYGEETRDPNREVRFESEVISETPTPVQIIGSESYDVGYISEQPSTHAGKSARLWKIVTVNGKEQSREVFNNSTYSASPRIITVGTRTSSEAARAAIQSAIASQNANNIYAAASNAAAIAAQPPEEPTDPNTATTPEEPTKPDESEKPKDTEKPKDSEKPKDLEKPKDSEKPKKDEADKEDSQKEKSNKEETDKK